MIDTTHKAHIPDHVTLAGARSALVVAYLGAIANGFPV
jgi:hypothetical protein